MVRFAVRYEMARSVADVLARRSRLLLLDARAASAVAPKVGAVIAEELGATFDVAASVAELQALAQACLDLP
jgi:glycerol-3-phosphate dehydrogenase